MISDQLINKALEYFEKHKKDNAVVKPSLPILYFGNLEGYKKSKIKAVTVGKNPSNNEFRLSRKDGFSYIRFPKWNGRMDSLQNSLNDYFNNKPLKKWFASFEKILEGLSCSYYQDEKDNIAMHIDICSPLATNPTWSRLTSEKQNIIFPEGFEIYKKLIEELKPDIILISVPHALFRKAFNTRGKELISF